MKFLNVIDGADKLKQDSNNRLVTDAEKTAWNGKQDALGYTPVNKAGDTMTGDLKVNGNIVAGTELIVGYNGTTESLQRHKWKYNGSTGYLELWRYSNQNKWELSATFPNRNTGEGGLVVEGKQMATEDYVDNKVKTDVPANAKFTDTITTINGKTGAITKADIVALGIPASDTNTTYAEITTAEIDAGTASTLRTITGRRIKYILDKVQGWINALTKADVGLGNVDNVKQASKTEFDAHKADAVKHITTGERTRWNNKAEVSQIPTKVSELENDANYVTQEELGDAGYGDMLKSIYDTDNDGKVDAAEAADSVPWTGVTGKPSTFPPSSHTHIISNITGLQVALDGKMSVGPLTWNDLKGV
jgi:hypothetical protein